MATKVREYILRIRRAWDELLITANVISMTHYIDRLFTHEQTLSRRIFAASTKGREEPGLRQQLAEVREELRHLGFNHVWTEPDDPNICPHGTDYDFCPDCRH